MTDDLPHRISQHKNSTYDSFTNNYKANRLMYYEVLSDSRAARAREKQIKKYSLAKKIALFAKSNPHWKDLSRDLYSLAVEYLKLRRGRAPSLRSGCLQNGTHGRTNDY
jgi:putative endonuclease